MRKRTLNRAVGVAVAIVVGGICAQNAQANILFEFNNETGLDDVGAGASMLATDDTTTDTRTITTVSATDALGNAVNTNVKSSWNALGMRGGADNFSFELNETWVFEFDGDVRLDYLDMAGVSSGDNDIWIKISSSAFDDIVYNADGGGDTVDLGDVLVTAGTDITLTTTAVGADTGWRLNELSVAIPEPSTLGLLSACTVGLFAVRRFRI